MIHFTHKGVNYEADISVKNWGVGGRGPDDEDREWELLGLYAEGSDEKLTDEHPLWHELCDELETLVMNLEGENDPSDEDYYR